MSLSFVPVVHCFPGWEIRPLERVLLVDGQPARVGSRAFDLLVALAERPACVVSKRELMERVWPDVVVEENNLSVQITALRKLLGSGAIVNVSGLGYQLASRPVGEIVTPPPRPGPSEVKAQDLLARNADLRALVDLLGSSALLSIVGAGGVGKTALAKAVLNAAPIAWRDGTHWIDLASLRDGTPLMPIMAASLGIILKDSNQVLQDFVLSLSQFQALIVLDNCEHLVDEVAVFVAPALQRAPGIRWLLTSRVPLRLPGGSVYRLEPLELPATADTLDQARARGAVALFCARVRAVEHRFDLSDDNLEGVIDICRQLDGIPLAIEMAAARVGTMGLDSARQQLSHKLRLSASPHETNARHHTLLQTLDWSYGLLSPVEQRVFRRLAPFVGGFTTAMAQPLCSRLVPHEAALEDWQFVDAMGALIDKSLVQRAGGGAARLYLFESARDYARMALAKAGEEDGASQRHAEVVAAAFDLQSADFERIRDQDWSAQCMPERHNVGAALAWVVRVPDSELLARLVTAQAMLDVFAQTQAEVVKFKLPLDVLEAAPPRLRARACLELGWAHYLDGKREFGTALAQRALEDYESLGDVAGIYRALTRLTRLYGGRRGTQEQALDTWRRLQQLDDSAVPLRSRLVCAITVGSQYGDSGTIARLQELKDTAVRAGFDVQAAVCRTNITDALLLQGSFEEVVETARTLLHGDESRPRSSALMNHNLALALVQLGRIDEARSAARATVRALPNAAHMIVDVFALAAARAGQLVDAALMAGFSAQIKLDRDLHSEPTEAAIIAETQATLAAGLGPERLAELMRLGSGLTVSDVLAMALPPTE